MNEIYAFALKASPTAILALTTLVIGFILYQLFTGKTILKISSVQDKKYPEQHEIRELAGNINTLLNNHFKHEIPEMIDGQKRIEQSVKEIKDEVKDQAERLTRVETLVEVLREKK